MKSRYLSPILLQKSKGKFGRIIVLTGARQTGKTTLSKKIFTDYTYISIEDPVTRSDYLGLTADQWQKLFPKAILDEVQKQPEIIESIKAVYDLFETPRFILLGSSQILLLDKVKESLAGRCLIYEIYPLTIPELMSVSWDNPVKLSFFQQFITTGEMPAVMPAFTLEQRYGEVTKWFEYYLKYGGYPALADEELTHPERNEWLQNYVRTYLERDVRDLVQLRDLEPFIRLQKTCASLTGCLINYSQLAREAGVSANTSSRYLRYLEVSHQAVLLKPWHKNTLKRLNKSPKIHFLDPGVHKAILNKQGPLTGNEFESAVFSEIYKQIRSLININSQIYHLRTSDGREVDVLIELENGYIAIEIKNSTKVAPVDARHLSELGQILDKPLIQCFLLSNDSECREIKPGILAMPAAMFLSS